jgi:hypothetical protein
MRIFFVVSAVPVILLLAAADTHACSVCLGDPSSPMTQGMNSAIWALLAVTGTVLSTFVAFFLYLWRRARVSRHTSIDTEWLEGLRGAKHV